VLQPPPVPASLILCTAALISCAAALHAAGLRYAFDPSKPAGARLVRALAARPGNATAEVDPLATYNVVTNDNIAGGGDGYTMITPEPSILPDGSPVVQVGAAVGRRV
jgi:5'-nucleotidase